MTIKQTVLDFLKKYRINVLDSSKRVHRVRYPLSYDSDLVHLQTDTEILHTIEISESSLKLLADIDTNFFKYAGDGHKYVTDIIISHKEEIQALETNQTLREMREQYEIYLKLCAKNPGNLKSLTNQ